MDGYKILPYEMMAEIFSYMGYYQLKDIKVNNYKYINEMIEKKKDFYSEEVKDPDERRKRIHIYKKNGSYVGFIREFIEESGMYLVNSYHVDTIISVKDRIIESIRLLRSNNYYLFGEQCTSVPIINGIGYWLEKTGLYEPDEMSYIINYNKKYISQKTEEKIWNELKICKNEDYTTMYFINNIFPIILSEWFNMMRNYYMKCPFIIMKIYYD
jgi:hypothetical protein